MYVVKTCEGCQESFIMLNLSNLNNYYIIPRNYPVQSMILFNRFYIKLKIIYIYFDVKITTLLYIIMFYYLYIKTF